MEYGLVGQNVSHSHSKKIHSMLSTYQYELFSVPDESFDTFIKARNYRGLNITIPYKKKVMAHCDDLSDNARRIGSVNTVVMDKFGHLKGYNTDYFGMIYTLRNAGIRIETKKVLILGSGGTSNTAKVCCEDLGASEIVVASRNGEINYSNIGKHYDSDIVINTTPVGMYPNNGGGLLDLKCFKKCSGVLDVIYNPLLTELALSAQAQSIPFAGGLLMLVAQAKYASELFTNTKIPDEKITEIYDFLYHALRNIVLIGMPGSGKTEIGQALAGVLNRAFIDTDEWIVKKAGMSIPKIFSSSGEDCFRQLESEVIAEAGKKNGAVIATGGGCVLKSENYYPLLQNGFFIFVDRALDALSQKGRPLSKNRKALEEMYRERLPLYREWCSYEIKNNGAVEDAVSAILYQINQGDLT